ncbi:EVE domain-containing protein [Spirosoma sp. KCTC 42546]|uniref:EVE domain-containing protein n=1 Tax=Spirosoma sp. KCTC 42546 TaxID=2520506 RepID=UPI00115A28DC|nr:EVE domain-containing protein [Spirosoma sp. KCTC 42546]QDK80281.1 EVE domain-containing protein [Spirosoma sp. KCTC 42546]
MSQSPQYWIVVASKDHVLRGVSGGFMQANHGKQAPLKRMKPGDWVIFYSPKQVLEGDQKCQAFTAIGQLIDDTIYQVTVSENFSPFRRNVTFHASSDVSILPLIDELDFISNKKSWGYPFRIGFFEIDKHDFELISNGMLNK